MTTRPELPVPGVRGVEHTADVGLEVDAPTLPELFRRGALGTMWLVLEREMSGGGGSGRTTSPDASGSASDTRTLELTEEDLSSLFRAWLRALLFWEETEGFVPREMAVSFSPVPLGSAPDGQAFRLTARVGGVVDGGPRVREIKGVTLHGLLVERVGNRWRGRVIFDV
ncbi:MAG: archease [Longimicrobiales bacterium]